MKWYWFVMCTVLCWGTYVSTLHHGQAALGKNSALRAFLFVGTSYFIISMVVLGYIWLRSAEPMEFTTKGALISLVAGVLGACGALGIIFAFKYGGKPIYVAPLVFAGAPIMNTIVSMIWDKPGTRPDIRFFAGIALTGVGAAMVLIYKPAPAKPTAKAPHAAAVSVIDADSSETST
jgi:hypothetical protein